MKARIYILSNPSMPGLIKIGRTINIKDRLKKLFTTGVPLPFKVEFWIEVQSSHTIEKEIHDSLSRFRVSKKREFFRMEPELALVEIFNKTNSRRYFIPKALQEKYTEILKTSSLKNRKSRHPHPRHIELKKEVDLIEEQIMELGECNNQPNIIEQAEEKNENRTIKAIHESLNVYSNSLKVFYASIVIIGFVFGIEIISIIVCLLLIFFEIIIDRLSNQNQPCTSCSELDEHLDEIYKKKLELSVKKRELMTYTLPDKYKEY